MDSTSDVDMTGIPEADPELDAIVDESEDSSPEPEEKTAKVKDESDNEEESDDSDSDESQEEPDGARELANVLKKYPKQLEGKTPEDISRFLAKHFFDKMNAISATAKERDSIKAERDKVMAALSEYQAREDRAKKEPEKEEPPPESVTRIEGRIKKLEARMNDTKTERDELGQQVLAAQDAYKEAQVLLKHGDEVSKERLDAEFKRAVNEYNSLVREYKKVNSHLVSQADDIEELQSDLEQAKKHVSRQREENSLRERDQQKAAEQVRKEAQTTFVETVNKTIDNYGLLGEDADNFFEDVQAKAHKLLTDLQTSGETPEPGYYEKVIESAIKHTVKLMKLESAKNFTKQSKDKVATVKALQTSTKPAQQVVDMSDPWARRLFRSQLSSKAEQASHEAKQRMSTS